MSARNDLVVLVTGCSSGIGSVSSVTAVPSSGIYPASKTAAHLVGDAMRMELAPRGLGAVTISAGGGSRLLSALTFLTMRALDDLLRRRSVPCRPRDMGE